MVFSESTAGRDVMLPANRAATFLPGWRALIPSGAGNYPKQSIRGIVILPAWDVINMRQTEDRDYFWIPFRQGNKWAGLYPAGRSQFALKICRQRCQPVLCDYDHLYSLKQDVICNSLKTTFTFRQRVGHGVAVPL